MNRNRAGVSSQQKNIFKMNNQQDKKIGFGIIY